MSENDKKHQNCEILGQKHMKRVDGTCVVCWAVGPEAQQAFSHANPGDVVTTDDLALAAFADAVRPNSNREYYCFDCCQLRLNLRSAPTVRCGNCGSEHIQTGPVGSPELSALRGQ